MAIAVIADQTTTAKVEELTFADLGLSPELLRAVQEAGFSAPMPVQARVIPIVLSGRDVIVQAQTGTGKTAAFALPILHQRHPLEHRVQALILTPTRELALQVTAVFQQLGRYTGARVVPVYGGQPIERQIRALRDGADIVVGTPGRIIDHLRRETLQLEDVRMVILDEADEMLNMGFIEDVEWILDQTPATRQTGLFSATIPERVAQLAHRYLHDPVRVTIAPEHITVPHIRQIVYEVPESAKLAALQRVLAFEQPTSAIIFCRTKSGADTLAQALQARGEDAEAIHGDLTQAQRDRVMARFRAGKAVLLVATDLAARGLDIPQVTHVINYDIPQDPESYVHRIGRTGRAGAPGTAITLVTPRERRMIREIERTISQSLERGRVPSRTQVIERQWAKLREALESVLASGPDASAYSFIASVQGKANPETLAAAAVQLLMNERERDLGGDAIDDAQFMVPVERSAVNRRSPRTANERAIPMVRLVLAVGRRDGVAPGDIVGAIANEARIPGRVIGRIQIDEQQSTVDVPADVAEQVLRALEHTRLRGKLVRPSRADGLRSRGRFSH
ncbi:DEAD/DEAH box helicase [Thermorudis peleae]|uniref:DEAD/DEAH box helicase n=1 Tax=Thermorudis peleae TaxID=1382356 RepID=UPI00068F4CA4|nr:DEAD/DEAH box helicase [Thermorudis peleae]